MSRTVTAMFDSRSDAEAAKERLQDARLDADNIRIHDQSSSGYRGEGSYSGSAHEDRGVWESIKNAFLPDEDRHTYEEGVRRGGVVLTADVDEDEADEAIRVLESSNSIDMDQRSQEWRSQGWDYQPTTAAYGGGLGAASMTSGMTSGRTDYDEDRTTRGEGVVGEEAIPVVEEKLIVGKREVDRGGVRVRSYVTETPVHEQVRLRNEHVDVERRRVDQPLSAADADAFRERTIEMSARGEEAMVDKEARVVEEVVVRKTADERVEEIDDSVRRTDVEVERDDDLDRPRSDRFDNR